MSAKNHKSLKTRTNHLMFWLALVIVALVPTRVAAAQSKVSTLTNADVVRFVAYGMPEQAVVNLVTEAVQARAAQFDLGPSAVSDLTAHGVSQAVMAAMRELPKSAAATQAPIPDGAVAPPLVRQTSRDSRASSLPPDTNAGSNASASIQRSERLPDKFEPTNDNVFVCKAKSLTALFNAVDAEHHGYFTQQFAAQTLRDNPDLATAAKADGGLHQG